MSQFQEDTTTNEAINTQPTPQPSPTPEPAPQPVPQAAPEQPAPQQVPDVAPEPTPQPTPQEPAPSELPGIVQTKAMPSTGNSFLDEALNKRQQDMTQREFKPDLEKEKEKQAQASFTPGGLRIGTREENAQLSNMHYERMQDLVKMEYAENGNKFAKGSVEDVMSLDQALATPAAVLQEYFGYSDEQLDYNRESFFRTSGYATPEGLSEETQEKTGIKSKPTYADRFDSTLGDIGEATAEGLAVAREERLREQAIFSPEEMQQNQDAIAEVLDSIQTSPYAEVYYDKNNIPLYDSEQFRDRFATVAQARDLRKMLAERDAELFSSGKLRFDISQNPRDYDKIADASYGYSRFAANGFTHALTSTPSGFAGMGISLLKAVDSADRFITSSILEGIDKLAGRDPKEDGSLTQTFLETGTTLQYLQKATGVDEYVATVADERELHQIEMQRQRERLINERLREDPGYMYNLENSIFNMEWGMKGLDTAGMLSYDMLTSFGTGTNVAKSIFNGVTKSPALLAKTAVRSGQSLTKSATKAANDLLTSTIKVETRPGKYTVLNPSNVIKTLSGGTGRTARANSASYTGNLIDISHAKPALDKVANIVRPIGKPFQVGAQILGKDIKHGPNTFLTRVYGETFITQYSRQMDRAAAEGRELDDGDVWKATRDAAASASIAHLIGRNIPRLRTNPNAQIPTSRAYEKGVMGLLGFKNGAATTNQELASRMVARGILGLNRSGADFAAFTLLNDAYMLTDDEDRADVYNRYINNSDKQFRTIVGEYFIGMAIGGGRAFQGIRSEAAQMGQFKSGVAATAYLNSLPSKKRLEVIDAMTEAQQQGYLEQTTKEKQALKENPELLNNLKDEQLLDIMWHGDRVISDMQLETTTALRGDVEARHTIDGRLVKGESSRSLLQADGRLGVTRIMAQAEAHRRGLSGPIALFDGARLQTLFATRAERVAAVKAQKQHYKEQREKRPVNPKPAQIRKTRGFIERIKDALNDPRTLTGDQIYKSLSRDQQLKVANTAVLMAVGNATKNVDAPAVRKIRALAKNRDFKGILSSPEVRPYLVPALRQHGLREGVMLKNNVPSDAQKMQSRLEGRALVGRILTSNPLLSRHVVDKVARGENTVDRPAISRSQFNAFVRGKMNPSLNTRANRQKLAELMARQAGPEFKQKIETAPATNRGEVTARTPQEQARQNEAAAAKQRAEEKAREPLELGEAENIGQVRKSTSKPIEMSAKDLAAREKEAAEAGAKPLSVGPIKGLDAAAQQKAAEKTGEPKEIDSVISRLAQKDGLERGVTDFFQVKDKNGKDVFKGTVQERVLKAVRRLKKEFGVENVEVDFGENVVSNMAESVFALGRINGFSVVIAHGKEKSFNSAVLDIGGGVLVVNGSSGISQVKAQIASRGATLKWLTTLEEGNNPITWMVNLAFNPESSSQMRQAWAAISGKLMGVQEFRNALLVTRPDIGVSASVFSMMINHLPKDITSKLTNLRPVEMAQWVAYQKSGLESVGVTGKGKRNTAVGTRANTESLMRIAEGTEKPTTPQKGKVRSNVLQNVDKAIERIAEATDTSKEVVSKAKAERETLAEKASVKEESTSLEKQEALIQKMKEERAELDLFRDKKPNLEVIKNLEQNYPGVIDAAMRAIKFPKFPGQPMTFTHLGSVFTVVPRKFNGKYVPSRIMIRSENLTRASEARREAIMSKQEKELADGAREVLAKGTEKAPVSQKEVERQLKEQEKAQEEATSEAPPPGEVQFENVESSAAPKDPRGAVASGLRSIMDPLNLSILTGNEAMQSLIRKVISIEARIENERNEVLDRMRRLSKAMEKDKTSLVANGKDNLFVEIFETRIEPTMEALKSHPLTKNLNEKEQQYIMEMKKVMEEQRLFDIDTKRSSVGIRFKSEPNAQKKADFANEAKPELKVKVVKEQGTNRKLFEFNSEGGRVRLDKEAFEAELKKQLVPDNYGYQYNYFPHMFFGNQRAEVNVFRGGEKVSTVKIGSGEKQGEKLERLNIMQMIEKEIDGFRAAEVREGRSEESLSFKVKMSKGNTMPRDVVHMPFHLKRRLVNAIREHSGAYASEINKALSGKISTKNYSKDINKVFEIAIANHYRNKLSRELQKETKGDLGKVETDAANPWMGEYARELMRHTVFGTRGAMVDKFRQATGGERGPIAEGISNVVESGLSGLRALQFYRQLIKVGQHLINSTQATQVYSLLGFKGLLDAIKVYNSAEGKQILKDWGSFDLNGRYDKGKFGDSLGPNTLAAQAVLHAGMNKVIGKVWNANSESRNQNFAFVALYNHARKNLKMEKKDAARYGLIYGQHMTQYRFQKANEARIFRGQGAKTLMQFKRYPVQTFGMATSLALKEHGKGPTGLEGLPDGTLRRFLIANTALGGFKASLLGSAAYLVAMSAQGVLGTFKKVLDDEHLPSMPNKFNNELEAINYLKEHLNSNLVELIMYGAPSVLGIDATANISLTNFGGGGLLEFFGGPTYSMVSDSVEQFTTIDEESRSMLARQADVFIGGGGATRGARAALELAMFGNQITEDPNVKNQKMVTPLGVLSTESIKPGTGEMMATLSFYDKFLNALGLRSINQTSKYLEVANALQQKEVWNDYRRRVAAAYNTDRDKAEQMIKNWNLAYGSLNGGALYLTLSDVLDLAKSSEKRTDLPSDERRLGRLGVN